MIQSNIMNSVKNMIVDADCGYVADDVYQALQSNMTFSKDNNFCHFHEINRKKTSINAKKGYDADTETAKSQLLYEVFFDVTFLGENSINSANIFNDYLVSFGSDFLIENYRLITIGQMLNIINVTSTLDREKYIKSYTVRFSLYEIVNIERSLTGYNEIKTTLKYIP